MNPKSPNHCRKSLKCALLQYFASLISGSQPVKIPRDFPNTYLHTRTITDATSLVNNRKRLQIHQTRASSQDFNVRTRSRDFHTRSKRDGVVTTRMLSLDFDGGRRAYSMTTLRRIAPDEQPYQEYLSILAYSQMLVKHTVY